MIIERIEHEDGSASIIVRVAGTTTEMTIGEWSKVVANPIITKQAESQ